MSATGSARPALLPGAEAGATLLEMLVVVAVLALATGLVSAGFRPALQAATLDAAAGELALTLHQARAEALRTSRPQAVQVASDGSAYLYAGRRTVLPGGARLDGDRGALAFAANGSAAGGRLRLATARRRWWLQVGPAGAVSLAGPG